MIIPTKHSKTTATAIISIIKLVLSSSFSSGAGAEVVKTSAVGSGSLDGSSGYSSGLTGLITGLGLTTGFFVG